MTGSMRSTDRRISRIRPADRRRTSAPTSGSTQWRRQSGLALRPLFRAPRSQDRRTPGDYGAGRVIMWQRLVPATRAVRRRCRYACPSVFFREIIVRVRTRLARAHQRGGRHGALPTLGSTSSLGACSVADSPRISAVDRDLVADGHVVAAAPRLEHHGVGAGLEVAVLRFAAALRPSTWNPSRSLTTHVRSSPISPLRNTPQPSL